MTQTLHFIEGSDWKDAVIALLDSRSPYRPWRYGFGEARSGDTVAIVLNTDPPSVLTALGRIGADGRPDTALINWPMSPPGLIDLATLAMTGDFDEDPRTSWQLRGNDAIAMEQILTECAYRHGESELCGHSSVVAARILLHSEGGVHRGRRQHRPDRNQRPRSGAHPHGRRPVAAVAGAAHPH